LLDNSPGAQRALVHGRKSRAKLQFLDHAHPDALDEPMSVHPRELHIGEGLGTDSQKPLALVIVAGLITRLVISIFLMPVLYALAARPDDRLEV
jgi:hypothetical protein